MPKTLQKIIAEHKDVNKIVISLSSIMSSFKDEVQDMMKNFTGYSELWEKEADSTVKEFLTTNPLMVDFEAKFRHYRVIAILFKFFKIKIFYLLLRNCKLKLRSSR